MNWLIPLVFSGLAFSSDTTVDVNAPLVLDEAAAVVMTVRDETETFDQVYPFNAGGRVAVMNVNGSITVEAWDRNEIRLQYVKTADTRERLEDVEVTIEAANDRFLVEAKHEDRKARGADKEKWNRWSKLVVDFKLMVPRGAVLDEIETVNGSVAVSGFSNRTKISAVNGSVKANNLRGDAELSTVNGEVVADFETLDNSAKINLATVNGSVRVTLPSDAMATVKADSLNGNITNDFGLTVRKGKYVGRDLYGRLGSGGATIKLNSVNGALTVARRNDGRSPHPTVNLLSQSGGDGDESGRLEAAKVDREVQRALRENRTAIRAGHAAAKAEIAKIAPEIARVAAASAAQAVNVEAMPHLHADVRRAVAVQSAALARLSLMDFGAGVPRIKKKENSFKVKGVPKVEIYAQGCSVMVRGWDKSEVSYQVVQFSDPRNEAPISINEEAGESRVTLRLNNAAHGQRESLFESSRRMRLIVNVPTKSNLKIETNGEIRLEGVKGDIDLSGDDEAINVLDSDGKLKIANTDGLVRILGHRGDLVAVTVDGEIFLEGDFASIQGTSEGGRFMLTVPEDFDADIRTSEDAFRIEDLPNNKRLAKGHWRFGSGGREYVFTTGSLTIQNKDLIAVSR